MRSIRKTPRETPITEAGGFLRKADPDKQKALVKKHEEQRADARRKEVGHSQTVFHGRLPPGISSTDRCFLRR